MAEQSISETQHFKLPPSYYVIDIGEGDNHTFLICEPVVQLDPGEGFMGISAADICAYIEKNRLPAAPLPGRPYRLLEARAGAGQNR